MSSADGTTPDPAADLQRELELRKVWFYECQLRRFNYDMLRGITEEIPDALLGLISEPLFSLGHIAGQIGERIKKIGTVYLDDQQPVWSPEERARRDAFATTLIGKMGNWLDFRNPRRLATALADLKATYEKSTFASIFDLDAALVNFGRKEPTSDGTGQAMSRAMLADAKPWLIPELYNTPNADARSIANWIANLEKFTADFEMELEVALGGIPGTQLPFDPDNTKAYRTWIKFMLETSSVRNAGDSVKVRYLDPKRNKDGKDFTYIYDIAIGTSGYPLGPVSAYPLSDRVKYWTNIGKSPLGEVYMNKANADMGLCLLMRLVYLFGTLPATLGRDDDLVWRKRSAPGDTFEQFFKQREDDPALKDDAALAQRLRAAKVKLQVILEESAAHPRSAAPTFSVLFQEVMRQGIRSFKFWLDEALRAKGNAALNKARNDTKIGDADTEMEYWSENHYIMFASSEYLAGQLWESDEFQPAKALLDPQSKSGILTGKQRRDRGKARVLKWLNNRLQFGWMEFNSSGYYREHLWALLNLADFALDAEVRDKAKVVVDLLLFDVVRFLHRGTMGAAGGRSQFKSKDCGWDNDLGDVIEIMLGTRGIFIDGDSQIGASLATSQYKVPDVLLQIGVFPPKTPFIDRSRVSITFDEAPRHGIGYSMKSDQKDSVMQGYASKRLQYSPFVDSVNQEIARTHNGYGATEDDTVFWLTTSAFFIKQTVRDQLALSKKFDLDQSGVFKKLPGMIKTLAGVLKVSHGLIGGALAGLPGAALGFFEDDIFDSDLMVSAADDLSVLLEGSTRTRANILTYRNRDVMLSSLQNFRAGQLNFQSSVNQATLNASTNVFTTAPFGGVEISEFEVGAAGGLLGGALGLGLGAATGGLVLVPVLAAAGAAVGVGEYEAKLKDTNPFGDDEDGPGWWTGYWALPMIAQHDSAAIIAYDFHSIQSFLAQVGSHVWFPQSGFDRKVERRTSAYDDANFPLLDITDIGPKGFWLFGKIVHPTAPGQLDEPGEAYVGVFSNQRPKWNDQDFDFYKRRLKEKSEKAISDAQDNIDQKLDALGDKDTIGYTGKQVIQIVVERSVAGHYTRNIDRDAWLAKVKEELATSTAAIIVSNMDALIELAGLYIDLRNLQRIWKGPLPDYFANRDWYVEGKNIWIIQVGSKAEFGDFDQFMERVSKARIHLDDAGDMECSYDIPKPDGSSDRLSLAYGDGGRFGLNGSDFVTDLYPRFENPFVRGGLAEWGQREYIIEWNGKSLLHDFNDFTQPVRTEAPEFAADAAETIRGLVLYIRTEDEDMDGFTVATATVNIGCSMVTRDQTVAAGPVDENTTHDAEWVFFDFPALRDADMALSFTHPGSSKGDDTPHWKMSFRLKALMGDRRLIDCSLSYAYFNFEDWRRTSTPFPFSVPLSLWRPWTTIPDSKTPSTWFLAGHAEYSRCYYDYNDLIALDQDNRLWHRRLMPCPQAETGWFAVTERDEPGPIWSAPFSLAARSVAPGNLFLFVASVEKLYVSWPSPSGKWVDGWTEIAVYVYPDAIFGIPDTTAPTIPIALSPEAKVVAAPAVDSSDGVDLYVVAGDGNFYSHRNWHAYDVGAWRKIAVSGFSVSTEAEFQVADDTLFTLDTTGALWAATIDHSDRHIAPAWQKIGKVDVPVSRFAATASTDECRIAIITRSGDVWTSSYAKGNIAEWVALNQPDGFMASRDGALAWAMPSSSRFDLFATGGDGLVYSTHWNPGTAVSDAAPWSAIGQGAQSIATQPAGSIAAICRVNGQIEVFAQGSDGEIAKTWWS